LPCGVSFVGANPLAGSEKRAIAAAEPTLFDGSTCILTPTPGTTPQAVARVRALWQAVSQRVVTMTPRRHDRLLAAVSHLPHLVAFSLMESTPTSALPLAPRSFLEATRVAKSDPDLWDDILLSNRDAVLAGMARFDARWQRFRRLLTHRNRRSLGRVLRHAQAIRQTLPD
jgi:prephenate dehydrogenase